MSDRVPGERYYCATIARPHGYLSPIRGAQSGAGDVFIGVRVPQTREVAKHVDRAMLIRFLDEHAARMLRTALSYAIEHLMPEHRAHYRGLRP